MFKKRLLALGLAATMLLSGTAVASFSDLEDHWAEDYMEDLYDRGYLSGYEDGTMQPEGEITGAEALVFLSRFYNTLTDDELGYITSDYTDTVEDIFEDTYEWAHESFMICLASGIVSEDELEDMDVSAAIEKEYFSVLLVRALGLEEAATQLGYSSLTCDDKDSIQSLYCGHIALLQALEIVTGDENNNFNPDQSVTRAVAATFVSRGLEYLEDNDLVLEIANYSGKVRENGILMYLSSTKVQIQSFDGVLMEFVRADDANITANSSDVGTYVSYTQTDGELDRLSVDSEYDYSDVEWVVGKITKRYSSSANKYCYVDDVITGESVTVEFDDDDSVIYVEGSKSSYTYVTAYDYIATVVDSGDALEAYVINTDVIVEGTITTLSYGTTITLKVQAEDGTTYVFSISASSLPDIVRDGSDITIDRLAVGDAVQVTLDSGEIEEIESFAAALTTTGTLVSSTTTSSGTFWVIDLDDGDEETYELDSFVRVYKGTTSLTVADVPVGSKIAFGTYNDIISEIEVTSTVSTSSQLYGSVIAADSSDDLITVLISGKIVYVTADCSIMKSSGGTTKISALEGDDIITAYGAYTSSTEFTATLVIVED